MVAKLAKWKLSQEQIEALVEFFITVHDGELRLSKDTVEVTEAETDWVLTQKEHE